MGGNVAVFELGAAEIAEYIDAVVRAASKIIVMDINHSKLLLAKLMGPAECIKSKDFNALSQRVLVEMTGDGLEHTFEAAENVRLIHADLEVCHKGWGECTVTGFTGASLEISNRLFQLMTGRVRRCMTFGDFKGRSELLGIAYEWMRRSFGIYAYPAHCMNDNLITTAFDLPKAEASIRSALQFQPEQTMTVNPLSGQLVAE